MSRANITVVLPKDVQLQRLFMHFCLPRQLLILCINSGSIMCTPTTYPVLPTNIYSALGSCKAQKDTSSPTPTTAAAEKGHCSSAPLGGEKDTWRGWINCMYKSHSSASSLATRSLRNADSRQSKNRSRTPLLIQLC